MSSRDQVGDIEKLLVVKAMKILEVEKGSGIDYII